MERSLTDVVEDLKACADYNKTGTLQAAFRFCEDLRKDTLELTLHVQALHNAVEHQQKACEDLLAASQLQKEWMDKLTDRIDSLEVKVEPNSGDE